MKKNNGIATLHLFGNLDAEFYESHLKDIPGITIHKPVAQTELHKALARFDIGLALDVPVNKNRELAITNKFLAYLQAGLFVIATGTPAQRLFLKDLPQHGSCFDYKENNFEEVLTNAVENKDCVRANAGHRYSNFKNNNWQAVSHRLTERWNN